MPVKRHPHAPAQALPHMQARVRSTRYYAPWQEFEWPWCTEKFAHKKFCQMIGCYTILSCKTNKKWCGILLAILNPRGSFWVVAILQDRRGSYGTQRLLDQLRTGRLFIGSRVWSCLTLSTLTFSCFFLTKTLLNFVLISVHNLEH